MQSINFTYFAQLVGVVGSGFLAQPITQLLGGTRETVWLSSVITILTVALSPPVTQAADYWGRKWFLVGATTLGFIGALVVSRAQSIGTVIAGFTITGCCYGAQPLLHAVVSEVLARKHRPIAQSTVNISAGTGAMTGLLMGGALLRSGELENFRIYMYVVAAIFAVATVGTATCYSPPARELQVTLTLLQKLQKLDWIGYFLFIPGLVLFCVALSWSQNPYPWTNARVLSPFIIGVLFMAAFGVYEWRFKQDGLLNHSLFRDRNFSVALWCCFVEGLAFFAANTYFIYEVSVFTGEDIQHSAFRFVVFFVAAIISSMLIGPYSSRRKALRTPNVIGFSLFTLFNILMATTTPSTPTSVFWGYPVLAGLGMGILLPTIMVAAQLSTPPELISTTSGIIIAARSLGAAIGLAVNNAIFQDALMTQLPKKIAAATIPLGLPQSSLGQLIGDIASSNFATLQTIQGVTPQIIGAAQAGALEAYSIAFRGPWIVSACLSFVAVICNFFIYDPHGEFTSHIDAPAEIE
ncbi:major facilitator superfamily domain-containing protein [Leptodontidium sp. 2 PMI_412]|nr:major facilitator superfamily domain-containing protein [Leptodontidium sp. 2 PMI_412]